MAIKIFDKSIKLAALRKALKDAKVTKGKRKLAWALANEIYSICQVVNIPNLYQKLLKMNPGPVLSDSEKVWLSDFQILNENCSESMRKLIASTFNKIQTLIQERI